MIQIEFMPRPSLTAILAGAFVTGIDIIAAEAHLPLGHPVITNEQNNPWNSDCSIDHPDRFFVQGHGQIAPAGKIKCLVLLVHSFGDALIEQSECPAYRSDVNRQIGTIEYQYLGIEHRINRRGRGIIH